MSALAASIRLQTNIVYAILLREMHTKYAKSRIGYLTAIIDPIFMIAVSYFIRYYLRGRHTRHGLPLILFLTTGYLVWYGFQRVAMDIASVTQRKNPMLMYPQVTTLDAIAASTILSLVTYTSVMILLSAAAVIIVGAKFPTNVPEIFFCFGLSVWLGSAVGVLMGVSMRYVPWMDYVYKPILRAGVFLSGVYFTADELPRWLLPYVQWNPIFHVAELMREAWVPAYESMIANLPYVLGIVLFVTLAALATERITRPVRVA